MTDINETAAKIDAEEQKTFDLTDRLKSRKLRSKTVKIYTDEITGEKLGHAYDADVKNTLDVVIDVVRERSGVLGDIDALESLGDLSAADKKRVKELKAEAESLRAVLEQSSLTFNLQAVPEIAIKSISRKVRKAFINKETKEIDADQRSDFYQALRENILADVITSVTDAEGAVDNHVWTPSEVEEMLGWLPSDQSARLSDALDDIQFTQSLAHSITDDSSF